MKQRNDKTSRVRLQKFLSDAGVASRRRAEELIEAGRVLVNDAVVDQLPAFVDPSRDRVVVDGAVVRLQPPEYYLVHKPKGVVCTNRDPAGRTRAVDLLPPTRSRLNVVGRLDADSTGLLLMTNDGELAEKITHPRLNVPKVYRVEVRGQVPANIAETLKKGVYLAEGRATASDVEIVHRSRGSSVLRITLCEGRNRQVRRMLARLDHPVKTLKRVQIGPLTLKGLPVGAARPISARELGALRRAIHEAETGRNTRQTARARRGRGFPPPSGAKRKSGRQRRGAEAPAGESGRQRPRRRLIR